MDMYDIKCNLASMLKVAVFFIILQLTVACRVESSWMWCLPNKLALPKNREPVPLWPWNVYLRTSFNKVRPPLCHASLAIIGGVARMSDPSMIQSIIDSVSIPVMAKVRIGHFVEAQVY